MPKKTMRFQESAKETRSTQERPREWTPPDMLRTPEAPPGFAYRWVRARARNEDHSDNILRWRRQGYEIVRPEELKLEERDFFTKTLDLNASDKPDGTVRIGDLILMKVKKEIRQQRMDYYQKLADRQIAAVNAELLRTRDPRMPYVNESRSEVTVGRPQPQFKDE